MNREHKGEFKHGEKFHKTSCSCGWDSGWSIFPWLVKDKLLKHFKVVGTLKEGFNLGRYATIYKTA